MVSNEDREAAARSRSDALDAIVLGVDWAGLVFPPEGRDSVLGLREAARQALDALISHGWGPKATVRIDRVAECIAEACDVGPATGYRMLTDHLRERGIGLVTE